MLRGDVDRDYDEISARPGRPGARPSLERHRLPMKERRQYLWWLAAALSLATVRCMPAAAPTPDDQSARRSTSREAVPSAGAQQGGTSPRVVIESAQNLDREMARKVLSSSAPRLRECAGGSSAPIRVRIRDDGSAPSLFVDAPAGLDAAGRRCVARILSELDGEDLGGAYGGFQALVRIEW
jgi:hypothetical protein